MLRDSLDERGVWGEWIRVYVWLSPYIWTVCMLSTWNYHNIVNQLSVQFSHSSHVWLFATPWISARQTSPSITSSWSLLKLMPKNWWCHPTISSSVIPFSSHLHSFPASGSSPMSQFFASGGQSIGVSASASVLPISIQDWFPLGLTGWISLQSKGLSRVFSNITVQKHQFFSTQLSLKSNSHIHIWLLEKPQPWLDRPLLAK